MGLKHASVRHPNVVVMAPALTEAGQSHNFKIPTTISSPVSPISIVVNSNGKRIEKLNCPFLKLDGPNESKCRIGMNGESLNITPKVFELNGNDSTFNENVSSSKQNYVTYQKELDENNIENKIEINRYKEDSNVNKRKNNLSTSRRSTEASEYSLLQIGGFMMNSSYLSMGDHEDNMGLHKSSTESSTLDSNNYLKMDQLFKNLGSTISNSDLGGSGDFGGQNVDDLFQAIKSMESHPNDIDEQLDSAHNPDSEGIFHMSDSADIAGSLSNFERDLFNDVDMMNMCDENLGDNSLVMVNKGTLITEKVDDVQKRQFQLERKCEWLIRRLRKLQARSMGKQASEEITGLLEHVNKVLSESSVNSSKPLTLLSALTSSHKELSLDCDKRSKTMSTAAMMTLMRRLDQSSQQQAVATARQHVSCKYFGSGSSDNSAVVTLNNGLRNTTLPGSILPKLSVGVQQEVEQVSGQLYTQLKTVENGIDSDVTASSSGAESCDEMQTFNNPHQQQLTIAKRASWRWAQDRAAVASRWTWLQAQISDLEYRIRQHTELSARIKKTKCEVVLGDKDPPKLSESENIVVNGYHGVLPGASVKSAEDIECESVCRTRPLVRSSFRKRKLLQTHGLHLVSKKASRPSTVRCGCRPPLPTCALCTGRQDPTLPRELPNLLIVNERIALLDPCFHPVLSFPSDVSQSIHFDAIMKTTDWQQKAQRNYLKSQPVIRPLESLGDGMQERRTKKPLVEHHRKKYTSGLKRTTANALSEKIKRKLAKGKKAKVLRDPNNHNLDRFKTRRRFSLKVPGYHDEESLLDSQSRFEDDNSSASSTPYILVGGVTHPSPVPSPSTPLPFLAANKGDTQRRKRENSYNIDSIIIPYSVAATTRVEKLQYKEILTPKWRVVSEEPVKLETKNNGVVRRSSQESDVEDISEESVILRHERCEQEERKKFSTYLKLPNSMARARSNRRADSRAESSGANTPDPMSPVAQDHTYGGSGSPMTSPPATPLPPDAENNIVIIRRRTVSLSRIRDKEESRCTTPTDYIHDEVVTPYEPRTFPLTDEVYDRMQKDMPPGYPFKNQATTHQSPYKDSESESRPLTPASDSTESADTFIDEDPNDPEWTASFTSFDRSKR